MEDIIWIGALVAFALWWFIISDLNKAGVLAKYNITAYGPLIMVRTFKGQKLLDTIAKPKQLWKLALNIGIPIIVATMIFMLVATISITVAMLLNLENVPAPSAVNEPQNIIAIPGLNQFIPVVWGWVALIIAMVVHEFGHAILAKVEDIKVKSLGLLLLPIPVGAFAEIDEEELFGTKSEGGTSDVIGPLETASPGKGLRKASSAGFIRILSAGVLANLVVAAIAFGLLFGPVMGSVAATDSGVSVYSVVSGSPADAAGIKPDLLITSVDGQSVQTAEALDAYVHAHPNKEITISGIYDSKPVSYTVQAGDTSGVYILKVSNATGMPASAAGLTPNVRIVAINGTPIENQAAFMDYMNGTVPGQAVTLTVEGHGAKTDVPVTLAADSTGTQSKGFIGVTTSDNALGIGDYMFDAQAYLTGLKDMPYSLLGWLRIIAMPVLEFGQSDLGYNVFHSPYAGQFKAVGWAAPLGSSLFDVVDCLFWIAWLNMNIAIFNCLPMIPLDGGHIFREITREVAGRFIRNEETVEKISKTLVNAFAITLLASLVFMIMAPYFVQWFLR